MVLHRSRAIDNGECGVSFRDLGQTRNIAISKRNPATGKMTSFRTFCQASCLTGSSRQFASSMSSEAAAARLVSWSLTDIVLRAASVGHASTTLCVSTKEESRALQTGSLHQLQRHRTGVTMAAGWRSLLRRCSSARRRDCCPLSVLVM